MKLLKGDATVVSHYNRLIHPSNLTTYVMSLKDSVGLTWIL